MKVHFKSLRGEKQKMGMSINKRNGCCIHSILKRSLSASLVEGMPLTYCYMRKSELQTYSLVLFQSCVRAFVLPDTNIGKIIGKYPTEPELETSG